VQLFGVIVFLVGLLTLNTSYRWTIYSFAAFCLFGCATALVLPGGMGIMPAHLFMVFLAIRAFNMGGGKMLCDTMAVGKPGFWLLCLALWAVFGAIALPRALAGSTLVFAVDRSALDPNSAGLLQPLHPVSGNITQTIYCLGDFAVYCCLSVFLTQRAAYRHFANAIFLLTTLDVTAALLEIAGHSAGFDVLTFVKTADYVYFDGSELGGLVRITGTFSEASAFAFFTLPLFAFNTILWLTGYRPKVSGLLAIATGVLLLLSTSGTAYVGLGGYLAVLLFSRPGRISSASHARKMRLWTMVTCLGVLAAMYVVLFMPGVIKVLGDFIDATILSKADSSSGQERSGLNAQALTNFVDTFGVGVGLGSLRASSFIVVVLSNLGIVGAVCLGGFLLKTTATPIPAQHPYADRAICYASRHAMFAVLIVASASGSMFDLGVCFYMFAAAAGALATARPARAYASYARRAAVQVEPEIVGPVRAPEPREQTPARAVALRGKARRPLALRAGR
jgi:hypothetical protein